MKKENISLLMLGIALVFIGMLIIQIYKERHLSYVAVYSINHYNTFTIEANMVRNDINGNSNAVNASLGSNIEQSNNQS